MLPRIKIFSTFYFSFLKKTKDNVDAICDDNTNKNRSCSRYFGNYFVGCHSHCFNLVVNDFYFRAPAARRKDQLINETTFLLYSCGYAAQINPIISQR